MTNQENKKSYTIQLDCTYFLQDRGIIVDTQADLIITDIAESQTSQLKNRLTELYDSDTIIIVNEEKTQKSLQLSDFSANSTCSIHIEGKSFLNKNRFSFNDLMRIVYRLRAPDGCKWDREQTHQSIRSCAVEEAYELVEAIDLRDLTKMVEESGDVLLQGVFHAIIAEGKDEFTTLDVLSQLCRKLVTRHTHIFGNVVANTPEEALRAWEEAKAKEKNQYDYTTRFDAIAKNLPSLTRAYKTQKLAAKVKFEWGVIDEVLLKIKEELKEFIEADENEKEIEGGDVLFSVVNLLRWRKVEPEIALNRSTNKFINRLSYVERELAKSNLTMETATVEQMWSLYDQSKQFYAD